MRYLSIFAILLGLMLGTSGCEDGYADPCLNCYQEEPTEGILAVHLTYQVGQPGVPVQIYQGVLEDNDLIHSDTVSTSFMEYWVGVGHRYTVTATYTVGERTVIAVDGDKVSVYLDTESCEAPCWRPRDGKVNCGLD